MSETTTKTITVGNAKEREGRYGPSLAVGVKTADGWDNYYVNKPELFSYFARGKTVTVEYEVKGGYKVIVGVAPETVATNGRDDATGRSIELQVVCKAAAEVYAASSQFPTAAEFAAWVTSVHERVFTAAGAIERAKEELEAEAF